MNRIRLLYFIILSTAVLARSAEPAAAQAARNDTVTADSARARVIEAVQVSGRIDDLRGTASSASQGRIGSQDLRARPLARDGELLETVPGMIVTQHSGEGKANQYFVRGFNLDHGTDFLTRVEGMPVNLPSHAHGQGWTDLNFLIPELVDHLEYSLGVYDPEAGDFSSAGSAEFHLFRKLSNPFAVVGVGENGMRRVVGAIPGRLAGGDLLMGAEVKSYDGPWQLPQKIRKISTVSRFSSVRGASRFSLLGMAYRNRWNSTDQIPLRAVSSGFIDRLGQIDATAGGAASRYSLSASVSRAGKIAVDNASVYAIYSSLDLYSNFTFFLDDSINGDQFNQRDRRVVLGAEASREASLQVRGATHTLKAGLQLRADFVSPAGLYRTVERRRLATVREDSVRQVASSGLLSATSRWTPWLRTILGGRVDFYDFEVKSSRPQNGGSTSASILSPKASVILTPGARSELYLSAGSGFHSNDARGTTITVDPATGDRVEPVDPLVRSRGAEIGLRIAPVAGMRSTLVLWTLALDSELLFTGDGGTTEPSAASQRSGVTWANFYRPVNALSIDADVSFARARSTGIDPATSRIPGALEHVIAAGVAFTPASRISGALRLRHFGAYPLKEDNSVRARATTLANATVGYSLTRGAHVQLAVLNMLNSPAYDIQYGYASRLRGEPAGGIEDLHFHPAEPRQLRLSVEIGLRKDR